MAEKVTIELYRSPIGSTKPQKATVGALGFKRARRVLEKEMTPQVAGMISKVSHLVRIVKKEQ